MGIWQDIRFAARLIAKEPWFTSVVVLVLAFGLGVNTAVFTIVNATLLRGLPFDEPEKIISLSAIDSRGRNQASSLLDYEDWLRIQRSFEGISASLGAPMNVSEPGRAAEQFSGTYQTSNTFTLIRQRPVLGRDFTPEDDRIEAQPVAIIGNGMWKTHFGGDANILGHVMRVNARDYTIIGVMAPDMKFPFNNDLWLPYHKLPPESLASRRNVRNNETFGRLGPGVSLARARAEFANIQAQLLKDNPDTNKDIRYTLIPFNDRVASGPIRTIFLSLMGAVAFVLLIACANVANLLLARSANRTREIAVRLSLGASRWRIVRQLLLESVTLSVAGGVLGLVLAVALIRWFDAQTVGVGKPYYMVFTMDPIVFVYLGGICIGTGVLFGLAPALHITKTDLNDVLKESGGRSGTGGRRARRWTSTLVVVEVALTLVLLAGAGFMMRSFMTLYSMDVGVDTSRLLTMTVTMPLTKYPRQEARAALIRQVEERLHGVSALQSVAMTTNVPIQGGYSRRLAIPGKPDAPPENRPEVTMVAITAGYFDTLGLKLGRGRTFTDVDGTAGHESAIVNQRFTAMYFPGEDPIGRQITLYDAVPSAQASPTKTVTIVGISPTVRQRNVQDPLPDPVVYLPYQADAQRFLILMVRAPGGEPGRIAAMVREEMRAIEPDLPLNQPQSLDERLAQSRWPFRVFGTMFAIFAVIALVLAAVGLYAVTAYSVSQRAGEIGVRMALGAQSMQVLWLVLKRSAVQLAIGLPLGIAGAIGVGRLLQSILVAGQSRDVITLLAIAAVMIAVSVVACLMPARRATQLDPVSALR
jgi:putative ABC transport system permease protein